MVAKWRSLVSEEMPELELKLTKMDVIYEKFLMGVLYASFNWLAVPFSFNLAIELWMKNGLVLPWLFFLSWRIVDLQRCINHCCTAKWLKCMYYIHSFSYSFHSGFCHRLLNIVFWAATVGLLVYPFYLYQCAFADPELDSPLPPLPVPPSLPTPVYSLCLWFCFLFIDRFVCVIF